MDSTEDFWDKGAPLVEFKNITVIRGGRPLLDSLSVTMQGGEHIAVLGPNGAGKTAFIRTITREYYPLVLNGSSSRIWGRDRWNVRELRSALGIVSNDLQFVFSRDLSGMEVIVSAFFDSVGLFLREATPEMIRKAEEIMEFLEISHLKERKMTEMSTGEARRFLIARALIHGPRALVLDEPTNSLDLHALHKFRSILRKIARSGTGIVLVTHNLQDIIPEISRVILMKSGRIIKDGPKETILTDETIGGLFGVPVRVRTDYGYYYATGY
ncbi:MAG TPA: ATP-binding cassette domain-containing protein [Methanoregulaceae archaeon]|nr:ATP-binding cassette domain-containing protein [Methanoregulaceae archaeon]